MVDQKQNDQHFKQHGSLKIDVILWLVSDVVKEMWRVYGKNLMLKEFKQIFPKSIEREIDEQIRALEKIEEEK